MTAAPALDARRVPLDRVEPSPDNPRQDLDLEPEFIDSIRRHGILEPLIVTPAEGYDGSEDLARFDLVAGHRRLAGAAEAGLSDVPVIVRTDLENLLVLRLVENLHRTDLTPLDEANAYARLIAKPTEGGAGLKQKDVAELVGRNQGHVSKRLSLLKLVPAARDALASGALTIELALEMAKLHRVVQDAVVERVSIEVPADAPAWKHPKWEVEVRNAAKRQADLAERNRAVKDAVKLLGEERVVDAIDVTSRAEATRGWTRASHFGPDQAKAHMAGDASLACLRLVIGPEQAWAGSSNGGGHVWADPYCAAPDSHATPRAAGGEDSGSPAGPSPSPATAAARAGADDRAAAAARLREVRDQREIAIADRLASPLPSGTEAYVLAQFTYAAFTPGMGDTDAPEYSAPKARMLLGEEDGSAPPADAPKTDRLRWLLGLVLAWADDALQEALSFWVVDQQGPSVYDDERWPGQTCYGHAVRHRAFLLAWGVELTDDEMAILPGVGMDGILAGANDSPAAPEPDEPDDAAPPAADPVPAPEGEDPPLWGNRPPRTITAAGPNNTTLSYQVFPCNQCPGEYEASKLAPHMREAHPASPPAAVDPDPEPTPAAGPTEDDVDRAVAGQIPGDPELAGMSRPDLVDLCRAVRLDVSPRTTMKEMRKLLADRRAAGSDPADAIA